MRPLVPLLSLLILTGCSTTATMTGIMQSWEGAPLDAVVSQWGYPASAVPLGDKTVYVWSDTVNMALPAVTQTTVTGVGNTAYATSVTTQTGPSTWSCTRKLAVNAENVVVGWDWGGNNCPFAEAMEYANWRRKQPQS